MTTSQLFAALTEENGYVMSLRDGRISLNVNAPWDDLEEAEDEARIWVENGKVEYRDYEAGIEADSIPAFVAWFGDLISDGWDGMSLDEYERTGVRLSERWMAENAARRASEQGDIHPGDLPPPTPY